MEDDDSDYGDEEWAGQRRIQAFAIPSLFVFKLPAGRLFVGPDWHVGTRDRQAFSAVGGHLGVAFNVAADHLSIVPELAVLQTVMGRKRQVNEFGIGQSVLTIGDTMIELGVSFSFGVPH